MGVSSETGSEGRYTQRDVGATLGGLGPKTMRTCSSHVRAFKNARTVPRNRGRHSLRRTRCSADNLPERPTKTALKKLKVAELKDVLAREGLDTEGKKDELVARLQDHLASQQESGSDASGKDLEGKETSKVDEERTDKEIMEGGRTPAHAEALSEAFRNASASARSQVDVEPSSVEDADVERANALARESTSKLQEALEELEAARRKETEAMERVEALEAQLKDLRVKAESMVDVNSDLKNEMETLKSQIRTTDREMEQSMQTQSDSLVVPRVIGAGLGAFGSAFVSAFRRTAIEASTLGNREWQRSTSEPTALPPDTKGE